MDRFATTGLWLLVTAGLLFGTGCGSGGRTAPKTVGVSGVVTLNGQPVEGAEVRFINEGFSGYGKTGPDGRYELVQGAVSGENRVVISKIEGGDIEMNPEAGLDAAQAEAMAMASGEGGGRRGPRLPRQIIPAEYSDLEKSQLTYPVPDGGTDSADFRLTGR